LQKFGMNLNKIRNTGFFIKYIFKGKYSLELY
jgi:hypothetical protein